MTPEPGGCGLPGHVTGGEGTGPGATHWCETCRLLGAVARLSDEIGEVQSRWKRRPSRARYRCRLRAGPSVYGAEAATYPPGCLF